jgi:hypothetical protein
MNLNKYNLDKPTIEAKFNVDKAKKIMYGVKTKPIEKFSLKNKINNFFDKFSNKIESILRVYLKKREVKKNKIKFEGDNIGLIDRINFITNFDYNYGDNKRELLNNELMVRRQLIEPTTKPCFYDPEINEIHNENLDNTNLKPLSQLIKDSNNEAKIMLERQKLINNNIVMDKKSPTWMPSHEPKSFIEEFGIYKHQSSLSMKDFLKEEE